MDRQRSSTSAVTLLLTALLGGCSGGSDQSGADGLAAAPPAAPVATPPAQDPAPTLRFEVIRVASGDAALTGTDLNNLGEVSGQSRFRAGVWNEASGVRVLATVAGMEEFGDWLNDAGWVAGHAEIRSAEAGEYTMAVWRPDGALAAEASSVRSWVNGSWARGINARNQGVGLYRNADGSGFFLWEESGLVDLGTLGVDGQALDIRINDHGDLAALVLTAEGPLLLLRSADGRLRPLGGGVLGALNNRGQVGGCKADQPTVWETDGTPRRLDEHGRRGCVRALNDRGDAVGYYYRDERLRQFLYRDGAFHDLADLLAADQPLGDALAINERGEILLAAADPWLDPAARLLRPRTD